MIGLAAGDGLAPERSQLGRGLTAIGRPMGPAVRQRELGAVHR